MTGAGALIQEVKVIEIFKDNTHAARMKMASGQPGNGSWTRSPVP
jgi:hypothetical protein